jgi:integrase
MAARLKKRGNVWYVWVKTHDGQWRRFSTNCTDKQAAERKAALIERECADPNYSAPNQTTFQSAVNDYIAGCRRKGLSNGTLDCYSKKSRHLIRVLGALTPVQRVTGKEVNAYLDTRLSEGASRNTIHKEVIVLRGVLKAAKREGNYPNDLVAVIPDWSPQYIPRKRWLTPSEYDRLVMFLGTPRRPDGKKRNYDNQVAAFKFLVATGARLSEMTRACPEDVDLKVGMVRIHVTKTKPPVRYVPITPVHRSALESVVWQMPFDPWVQIRRDLAWACEKLGIPRCSPNDLRRTHGKWLRMSGVRLDEVAGVLGHKDTRMATQVYAHLEAEELRDRVLAQLTEAGDAGPQ